MPKINISQAAKMTGKTRTTIYKKIKSGELSAELGSDGNRLIDTAELLRVFGELVTICYVVGHENTQIHCLLPGFDGSSGPQRARLRGPAASRV